MSNGDRAWSQLELSDEGLMKELQSVLTARVSGSPYSWDGKFAKSLSSLPVGLQAMAATHWLDISLTLDSITWHFGNFGEPALVFFTEAGLRELGLLELADCFAEAAILMTPLLKERGDKEFQEMVEDAGVTDKVEELNRRAWHLAPDGKDNSVIYGAWVRYTRSHPELVFG